MHCDPYLEELMKVSMVRELPRPYLLFLGEDADLPYAKTAFGLRDWAPEACVGELSCAGSAASVGLPVLSAREARDRGARAAVIGVANMGGKLKDSWLRSLLECIEAGLDVISGMHGHLSNIAQLAAAARQRGTRLIDIRVPPDGIPIGNGQKRSGMRLLTVGTDCALGKKYTALSLSREFRKRGVPLDFRATGQTGMLISGSGIPIDAVVADFVAGAAELLSPAASPDHWDVIEGQGSLFHPAYAGVSLGLLHGSQPDVIVLCHQVGRDHIMGLEKFATPSVTDAIAANLMFARLTNPKVRCGGIALNTAGLSEVAAKQTLADCRRQFGMPTADSIRGGSELDELVQSCLS
jgi:uncharacterized NAD-dependent epimerase/dehydratase family protein